MDEETKGKIIEVLLDGLYTDGAHHKQYYLKQALILLVGKDEVEEWMLP